MAPDLNIVINIAPRDAARDAYAVQLLQEGKPLADVWARIDRQVLLEHEHTLSAHDYGMELYDALFTGSLGRAYQRLLGQAGSGDEIRVQLVIHPDAPELHALAWERLFHVFGDDEAPLAATARTPFSRFLVSGAAEQPPVTERPVRLLVAIANPTDLPEGCLPLDVAAEIASLADLVAASSGRLQGALIPGRTGLPADLSARLSAGGWTIYDGVTSWQAIQRHLPAHHILHILAHGQFKPGDAPGKGNAYLLMEHEGDDRVPRGGVHRIADDDIAIGLAGVDPLPQLIFLAACDSARRPAVDGATTGANPFVGLAPKLVAAGAPAVIAMQDEVPIALAQTLAADFYHRLIDHGRVDRALNEARSLVFQRNTLDWAIPVLFLRLQDGRLFAEPQALPGRNRLQSPPPPETFIGRVEVLKRLSAAFTANPDAQVAAAIQGLAGQGKSTVARVLGRDLQGQFPGGVLWVDVGQSAPDSETPAPDVQQSALVSQIGLELGLDLKDVPQLQDRTISIRRELDAGGRLLAILIDVSDPDLGRWLLDDVLPDQRAVLLTTRLLDVAKGLANSVERLGVLSEDEGIAMLARLLGPLGTYEPAARQIVELLEGLPLALELAARRCDEGATDLPWLLRQLQSKPALGVLTLPGKASADTSLESALSLNLQGLDEELVRRFRALGAFAPAPFDLAALAAVWGDATPDVAEDAARELARRALLQRAEDRLPAGVAVERPVYVQHALLRTYALALAQQAGEAEDAAARHAGYYQAVPDLSWQEGELFWLQVAHAWEWTDGQSRERRMVFIQDVKRFAFSRGFWEPVRRRAEALLAELSASSAGPEDQGFLLTDLGYIAGALGDKAQALAFYEQALPIKRQVGDKVGEAVTLNNIGRANDDLDDKAQALAFYEQALPIFREVGDVSGEATTINNIGRAHADLGDISQAMAFYEQALALYRQTGDAAGEAITLNNIGSLHADLGDNTGALAFFEQALPVFRQLGDQAGEADALNSIGLVHTDLGDMTQGLAFYEQALVLQRQLSDRGGEATTLNNIAGVHARRGDAGQALAFYEQALSLLRQVGDKTGEATTLSNIGAVHADLGDDTRALTFYQQALPLFQQAGDKAGEAGTLNNIGGAYFKLGERAQALASYEQAVQLLRDLGDMDDLPDTLVDMAIVQHDLGDTTKALACYEEALSLYPKVGDKAGEASASFNMAGVYVELGDLDAAEELLVRAVALDEATGNPNLESDRKALARVRTMRARARNRAKAAGRTTGQADTEKSS